MNRLAQEELTTTPEEAQTEVAPQAEAPAPAPVTAAPVAEAPAAQASEPAPAPQVIAPAPRVADRSPSDLNAELLPSDEDGAAKEVPNGRAYEITYIVRANEPEAVSKSQAGLKALVDGVDGAVDNVRVSEIRRLAYPINKQVDGVYVVVNARFEKTIVQEIDRYFKLEETVLRHIVLRKED